MTVTITNAIERSLLQAQEALAPLATVIRVSTRNDRNGNPRRAYVAMVRGQFIGAWDEGYDGLRCVPAFLADQARYCLTFEVTVDEYKRQLAWAAQLTPDFLISFANVAKEAGKLPDAL